MRKILLIICIFANFISYSQDTYMEGKTEYYNNQYYSTTGKPAVKRSESNKKDFLKSQGYSETPNGYQIDHIMPLSEGGTDDPRNMQLLTIKQHKEKTARERNNRSQSNSTNSLTKSYYNSTYINSYEESITIAKYARTDNGRIIYKGTSGGDYFLTDSGNKVYVKNNTSNTTPSNSSNSITTSRTSNSTTPTSSYYTNPTYSSPSTPSTSSTSSKVIQTGPRGGQYYINSNGNKTYVKK